MELCLPGAGRERAQGALPGPASWSSAGPGSSRCGGIAQVTQTLLPLRVASPSLEAVSRALKSPLLEI